MERSKERNLGNWCVVFPGREAVEKGMDISFYDSYARVREVFHMAERFCQKDIADLCYGGVYPEVKWQAVCMVTHCYAIYQIIREYYGKPCCTAGFSQGEFSAAAAAGVFAFPEILRLVENLENLLQQAKTDECMYRMIDIETPVLEKICRAVDPRGEEVGISVYISSKQNIISGKIEPVQKVIHLAKQKQLRWAIRLEAGRAFHSSLCNEEAKIAGRYFRNQSVQDGTFPVYSCYDGEKNTNGYEIRKKLSMQINHPIKWERIVRGMSRCKVAAMIEIGPGCTVSANSRLTNTEMEYKWIGCKDDL